MQTFLSTSTVCLHSSELVSHITSSHAPLFACHLSPSIPPLSFVFYFPRHLSLILPPLSYIPPTVTVKLLITIRFPLYKKKLLHTISTLSFIPGAAVFFLDTVFSGIKALYHRTGITVHFAARSECFSLPHTPWALSPEWCLLSSMLHVLYSWQGLTS